MREASRSADWIELEDAISCILEHVAVTDAESVILQESLGRTLAEAAVSSVDLPPWDNSAMDGFAVRADDVAAASATNPVALRLIDSVAAGAFAARAVAAGCAIKIMTGAPVPDGADSVIRVEHTTQQDDVVLVSSSADARRNIRPKGEDIAAGTSAVAAGTLLRAGEIGLLASIGCATVRVRRKPVIAILSTGDELVDINGFSEVAAGRKIVNSNSYALAAAVRAVGGEPLVLGIARDNEADLRAHLLRGLQADALVTSAGASVGEHDLVKDVLESLGALTHFWRVRIRPGSPFSFATSQGVPIFGLPGNPVSAIVTFEILVKPALRKMLGRARLYSPVIEARLAERVVSTAKLTQFLRVTLEQQNGTWIARTTGAQGSGILSSVARADGLLVLPQDVGELPQGAVVSVVRLTTSDEAQTEPGYQTRMTS